MSKNKKKMSELTTAKLKEDLVNHWLYFRHPWLCPPLAWVNLIIRGVDLSGVRLDGATFTGCKFFDCKIGGANRDAVKFFDCTIDDYQKTFSK